MSPRGVDGMLLSLARSSPGGSSSPPGQPQGHLLSPSGLWLPGGHRALCSCPWTYCQAQEERGRGNGEAESLPYAERAG